MSPWPQAGRLWCCVLLAAVEALELLSGLVCLLSWVSRALGLTYRPSRNTWFWEVVVVGGSLIPATLGSAARGQPCPCDEGSFLASHRWIAHPLAPPTPHVCPVCSPILVWTAQPALATLPLPTEFHVCLFENPALNTHPGGFLRQGAGPGRSGGSGSEPKAVGLGGFPCAVCRLIWSKHVTTQYCAKCVSKEAAPSAGLTCPRSPAVRVLGCALWVQVGSQEGTWLVPYAAPYLPPV